MLRSTAKRAPEALQSSCVPARRRVVAIVLSHERRVSLLENLASLHESLDPPAAVIVFDNASTDGSAEAVTEQFPDVELLRSEVNLGVAEARNRAWRHAETHHAFDYLLFLDDDSVLTRECIGHLVRAFEEHPEAGVLGGKAFVDREQRTLCSTGIRTNFYAASIRDLGSGELDRGQYDEPGERDAVGGFAQMIRRTLFEDLDGFDERFKRYGWEDVDLCLRARAWGRTTRYVPTAVVIHKGTQAARRPVAVYENAKAANFPRLALRHSSPLQKLCLCVVLPVRVLLLWMRMLLSGNAAMIPAQFSGALEGFRRSIRTDPPTTRDR